MTPDATEATPQPAGGGPPATPPSVVLDVGRRRTVIDIAVQLVARAANLLLGVVVTLIIVRALGASGFGQWSTILAVAQIATSFGDLGLSQVVVSRAARDPAGPAEWLGALLGLRLVLSVPILLVQLIVVLLVAPSAHVRVAGVIIAATTVLGAAGSLTAAFQLRVRNDLSMLVITVNSVLWTGGTAAAAAFTSDIRIFAIVFLVASVVSTAITVWLALRGTAVRLRGVRRLWGPLLRVGIGLGGAGILVTLYVRLDQILVFHFAGSYQAGLYGAAYRILDQIQFLPASVMTTLFPLIASAYPADLPRARALLQTSAEYLSMASLGALAFTVVAAQPIMVLLFGSAFAASAPALPILMGAFVSISFGYLAGNMVAILSLQRQYMSYAAMGLLLNAGLNIVLIPRYGFEAAAWITLATEVLVMSQLMRSVLRTLEMRPQFGRLGRIAFVAAAMGVVVWLARQLGGTLFELIALAAIVYVSLLVISGALSVNQVRRLLRRDEALP